MADKFFGIIEGFYGRHYNFTQRCDLIRFLGELKLNTYVYAPKDDSYHRKEYHRLYPKEKLNEFYTLNKLAGDFKIQFNYALAPGPEPDLKAIVKKINQLLDIGIFHFSILFDDIKIELNSENAEKQVFVANELFTFLEKNNRNSCLFFCPTQYHGFKETEYLKKIAKNLNQRIYIFWTGRNIVSRRITLWDVERIISILKRPPLIWDNIFANDYIPGIILKFPYRGREPEIVKKVSGILINPMNQYKESKPLVYTASKFFTDPLKYDPKGAWQEAKNISTELII